MHLRETGLNKVIVTVSSYIITSFIINILGFQDVNFNHITCMHTLV